MPTGPKLSMKKVVSILLASLLLIGCSRFEDGPGFSLRTSEKRALGTFEVDSFYKNGCDITGDFRKDSAWIEEMTFHLIGDLYPHDMRYIMVMPHNTFTGCTFSPSVDTNPSFGPINKKQARWSLTRLTYREKWYKITFEHDTYQLRLKRK